MIIQTEFDPYILQYIIYMQSQKCDPSMRPVFSFKKAVNTSNKLINKKLNVVEVDDKLNIVQCKDTQTEPTVTRAENSLCLENSASYFQVEILKTTEEDAINIGLISKDCNNKQFLGKSVNTFGFLKGAYYLDKRKVGNSAVAQKLKEGDRMGIGINCHKRTFFGVKNGVVIMKGVEIPHNWHEYIPAVSLSNQHEKVRFYFNAQSFQFKFYDYCHALQEQMQAQIEKTSNFTNNQIYSLVHEYLSFNKYTKTLTMLNEKKIQFHRLGKYTKNPAIPNPSINLQKKGDRNALGEDSDMNEPLKSRGRIMSERLNENDELQLQVRRKNTEMIGEQDNVRKCSMISNLSNISNMPLSNLSEENDQCLPQLQQEIQEKLNENEQFLDNQRIKIVELIRHRKIQQAIELMQSTIPQIFDDGYIMAFMKAHIFLMKIRDQSNRQAIEYSTGEREVFKRYYSTNFPFFNGKNKENRPLFTIFQALSNGVQVQCNISQKSRNMIADCQFQGFASYINQHILNKMGYLACSRLTYYASHMKKIQQKLKELKGMSCGIEFKA